MKNNHYPHTVQLRNLAVILPPLASPSISILYSLLPPPRTITMFQHAYSPLDNQNDLLNNKDLSCHSPFQESSVAFYSLNVD